VVRKGWGKEGCSVEEARARRGRELRRGKRVKQGNGEGDKNDSEQSDKGREYGALWKSNVRGRGVEEQLVWEANFTAAWVLNTITNNS
jgi:hypothetical protein